MHLFLGSQRTDALGAFLARAAHGERAVFVPTAANDLPDRDVIAALFLEPLRDLGFDVRVLDLDDAASGEPTAAVAEADMVFLSAGNPYRLLDAAMRSGFPTAVRDAVGRGVPYVGMSAGAMVAAPSLEPIRTVSPFQAPEGDPVGLNLTPNLILPHDNRPGRAEKHHDVLRRLGHTELLFPLTDDEALILCDDDERVVNAALDVAFRRATLRDAAAVADVYVAAARAGWRSFISDDDLARLDPPTDAWRERVAAAEPPAAVLVAEDDGGVMGFAWTQQVVDDDVPRSFGELAAFYTHPRAWGAGIGRRLMERSVDLLRASGADEAVLWTEERNERPRRTYERFGWRLDGTAREREFLGLPIRELRYRLPLT